MDRAEKRLALSARHARVSHWVARRADALVFETFRSAVLAIQVAQELWPRWAYRVIEVDPAVRVTVRAIGAEETEDVPVYAVDPSAPDVVQCDAEWCGEA